jgi:hypothetical protein
MSDLCFVENRGQWSKDIIYRSYLKSESIIDVKSRSINIYSMNSPQFLTITFPSMRYISLEGVHPSPSINNYYKGPDDSNWAENCKHYSRLRINETFDLILNYDGISYECLNTLDKTIPLTAQIHTRNSSKTVKFSQKGGTLWKDSNTQSSNNIPLEWKPELESVVFSTLFCRNNLSEDSNLSTRNTDMVIDDTGNSYIIGYEDILEKNEFGNKKFYISSFIAKFSPEGNLLFNTFFGSDGDNKITYLSGIQIDQEGYIWIAGSTNDKNFPLKNPWKSIPQDEENVFIAKLSPKGELLFSTLWGGSKCDILSCFKIDKNSNLYLTGNTSSLDFPLFNPILSNLEKGNSLYITSIASDGEILFSTFWLNNDTTNIVDMSVDSLGNVIFGGKTYSDNLPVKNALQEKRIYSSDGYLAKISKNGELVFCTYFGGNEEDNIDSLTLDVHDQIIAVGNTLSSDFPITNPYFGKFIKGAINSFLIILSPSCKLIKSDLLGDFLLTKLNDITVDSQGNYYITTCEEPYYYPQAFHLIKIYRHYMRVSRIFIYLPSLQPYYNALFQAECICKIKVSKDISSFWIAGNSSDYFPSKNAYIDYSDNQSAFLARLKLPPALSCSNKLSLQISNINSYIIKSGEVTSLPPLDTPPIIYNGRTMVPIRLFIDTYGMKIKWEAETRKIYLEYGDKRIELQIGRKYAVVSSLAQPEKQEKIQLDTPPIIQNNRTLVPLRFIGETFGSYIEWNANEQRILVSWNNID